MALIKITDMSDVLVIINDTVIHGVINFKVEKNTSYYDIMTFGDSAPLDQVLQSDIYSICLTVYGDITAQIDISSDELALKAGTVDSIYTYSPCRVKKCVLHNNDDGKVYTDITFSSVRRS